MNKEAKQYVDEVMSGYEEISYEEAKNKTFNIIHIYDTKKYAYPNGYIDANFIKVVFFNSEGNICYKPDRFFDSVDFTSFRNVNINQIKIFPDRSTMVWFKDFVRISFPMTQCLCFE